MNKLYSTVLVLYFFLLLEGQALAYLDPGSGSMILQVVLGGLAGAALVIKAFYRHFINFFKKPSKKEEQPASKE